MFKTLMSALMIVSILTTLNLPLISNSALNQAKSATRNINSSFDGTKTVPVSINSEARTKSLPSLKASDVSKANTETEPEPAKPSFMSKVFKDIKENKVSYITVAGAAGFLGFILGGPIGALIGAFAMTTFTVMQRSWYIDSKY